MGRLRSEPLIEKRNVAGNLKRIEQTAKAQLEELMNLGDRFNDAYDRYLQVLAPAVQKHLILATYQICTRGYPEQFLALSLDERVSVQSQLQQLAQQIRLGFEAYFESDEAEESESSELTSEPLGGDRDENTAEPQADTGLSRGDVDSSSASEPGADPAAEINSGSPLEDGSPESPRSSSNPEEDRRTGRASNLADISTWRIEDLASAKLRQLLNSPHSSEPDTSENADNPDPKSSQTSETLESDDSSDTSEGADPADTESPSADRRNFTEQEAQLIALALKAKLQAEASQSHDDDEDVTTPDSLRSWQRSVESDIARMLQQASVQANQLLHQYGILPQEFPLGLLEAFGQGEAMAEIPTGTPNLLKLTIKSGSPDTNESHNGTLHLMAIHLHLAEIEFSETAVSQARHTIRQLLAELSGLRKRYAANQKEYTIAKAEAAWRSTWSRE